MSENQIQTNEDALKALFSANQPTNLPNSLDEAIAAGKIQTVGLAQQVKSSPPLLHQQVWKDSDFQTEKLKAHFSSVTENLKQYVGRPGFNAHVYSAEFVRPLKDRLATGERSLELQESILALDPKVIPYAKGCESSLPKDFPKPTWFNPKDAPKPGIDTSI